MDLSFYWSENGGTQGHAVAARAIEGTPSDFTVSVYDPNYPKKAGPRFVVRDNHWWLENDPQRRRRILDVHTPDRPQLLDAVRNPDLITRTGERPTTGF